MKEKDIVDNRIVSVIIPVFQAEKYLSRCVASVTKQTYDKLEIILMDDGSTDNSLRICYELAQEDSRIKVFHQENMGVAATRNKGLDYATGQFIYFLDSDDWIDENTLSVMVKILEEYKADLCICGFYYMRDREKIECSPAQNCQVSKQEFLDEFFWKLYDDTILFNIGTKLYRRSIIEEKKLRFCEDMVVYEDIKFCLEYIDLVKQIFVCKKSYYYYFQGNVDSITHVYKKDFWKSTGDYCQILISRFNDDSLSIKKAILICLYRAYLQECHNPNLKKTDFDMKMKEICYPYVEKAGLKGINLPELSIDQRVFMKLISWKCGFLLWVLAAVIWVKNR